MNKRAFRDYVPIDSLAWILTVFTCTFFYYRDFGHRMIYGYSLLGLALVIHLLTRLRRNDPPRADTASAAAAALAVVITILFLLPGARRDEDTFAYVVSMLICTAYVLIAPALPKQLRGAQYAMYVCSMAMAVFVVVFTLLPELFTQVVYPLLSPTAQRYYDFFHPLGYGVSLGTYSYTDYVLFLGVAVCCADLASKPRTARRLAVDGLSLAAVLAAMIVLGRRGELLAAAVAVLVLALALCGRKKRRVLLISGTVLCAVGAALVLAFLPQLGTIPVLARYVETIEQLLSGADFTSGRGPLLAVAAAGFRSSPLFGVGYGQYVRLSAQIGMCDTDGNLIEDCHNIYLQFLCENGIVGAVLILIPIVYLLLTTCRMLRHAKYLTEKTPLELAAISFLIQFFLLFLGLYDPSFQKIVFWCFYGVALLFLRGAMRCADWYPGDAFSRLLERLIRSATPVCRRIWSKLRTLWKEGT